MTTTSSWKNALLPLAALAALAGCTTSSERGDLEIIKIVKPTVVGTSGSACEINPTTAELAFGGVDPTVAGSYFMGVVVSNRLGNNANVAAGRLNTNDFQVEQARITYEFPDPSYSVNLGERVTPANGVVPANGEGAVGVYLIGADGISALKAATGATTSGTVRLKIRLEGKLIDGSGIKTSLYEYVIRVCQGCSSPPAQCVAPKVSVPCLVGQDSDSVCQ